MPTAMVPVRYAAAMAAHAVAAPATGWLYDRFGAQVLVVLPLLSAVVPALAFTDTVGAAVAGALVWGAAVGVFAGIMGAAALVGGALAGVLYDISVPLLIVVVAGIQTAALVPLWVTRAVRSTPVRLCGGA
ncbi:hypothetical protein [Streptomyces mirabilis]